jgi:hypothetical protein
VGDGSRARSGHLWGEGFFELTLGDLTVAPLADAPGRFSFSALKDLTTEEILALAGS